MQKNYLGFSLIEMMIVIALIAITISIILPTLSNKKEKVLSIFEKNINLLLKKAHFNAIETGKIQKIYFDLKNKKVELQEESSVNKNTNERVFSPVKSSRFKAKFDLSEKLEFNNFYINTVDGIKDQMAQATNDIWFFITSVGIAQDVVINIIDTQDQSRSLKAGLVLNPFTLVFEKHETFQKL